LWNHGAEIANRVFTAACPDWRPQNAEPGLTAIEAEIANYRRSDASPLIIEALETARANVIRWLAEQLGGKWAA
jgi:hypothetical protein